MLIATSTGLPHGANVVAIKHVLHRIHAKKSIVVRAVMAMEVVISILKFQEAHVGFGSLPSNCRSPHWIVLSIMAVSTLCD
jgi:hypothetical protein